MKDSILKEYLPLDLKEKYETLCEYKDYNMLGRWFDTFFNVFCPESKSKSDREKIAIAEKRLKEKGRSLSDELISHTNYLCRLEEERDLEKEKRDYEEYLKRWQKEVD